VPTSSAADVDTDTIGASGYGEVGGFNSGYLHQVTSITRKKFIKSSSIYNES